MGFGFVSGPKQVFVTSQWFDQFFLFYFEEHSGELAKGYDISFMAERLFFADSLSLRCRIPVIFNKENLEQVLEVF